MMRGLWILAPMFGVACGGLMEIGALAELQDLHARNECATLVQRADEAYLFVSDRPDLVAEVNFLKADCLMRMSKDSDAIALYKYVAEQHPDSPFAYQARARVEEYERRAEGQ